MKRIFCCVGLVCLVAVAARAQRPEIKFIADTLVVEAEGRYEADPDLATLTFDISSQDKELKRAYDTATQSMHRVVALAERTGLKKEDVSTGVLRVTPLYGSERRKKARAYFVQGQIVLKVRDFSQIGPIFDGSVEDGIADFRSLAYSLQDEEAAKKQAVAEAMRRALGRASAALAEKGQKVGALRYASLDVKQLMGVAQIEPALFTEAVTVSAVSANWDGRERAPRLPPMRPEKVTVSATVQCAFQIQ